MDIVDPVVERYVSAHCTGSDVILRDLADETAARFAPAAGMQISYDEGVLLSILVGLTGARQAVEIGVFTGFSSICIARALAPGGRLLACDVSEEWTAVARRYWQRAGVEDRIDLRLAPAADTLRSLPAEPTLDFAFIDADKTGYPVYYEEVVTRLRPGGVAVLDNVLRGGRVTDPDADDDDVRVVAALNDEIAADPRVTSVMLPVRDGVTIARRVG